MAQKKILAIEPDSKRLNEWSKLLSQAGYAFQPAGPDEALAKARVFLPDLILLDLLASNYEGLGLLKSIRSDPAVGGTPVLVVSENPAVELITGANPIVSGYLTKPVDFDDLKNWLTRLVPRKSVSTEKPSILVVDDDSEFADLMAAFLEKEGFTPRTATTGAKALALLDGELPKLVLLDLMLPQLDGFFIAKRLASNPKTAGIPVLILSAMRLGAFQEKGALTGETEIISKEVPADFLLSLIRRMLARPITPEGATPPPRRLVRPRMLVADDDVDLLKALQTVFELEGFQVFTAANGQEAMDLLRVEQVDIAIVDWQMPLKDGFQVCQEIRGDSMLMHLPVFIFSGAGTQQRKVEGLNLGADDFITKPVDLIELLARVRMVLKRTRQGLDANPLTHLPGNVSIETRLTEAIGTRRPLAVLYIDINQFKAYNDAYGYDAGDQVIRELGKILVKLTRGAGHPDFVGHIGGDDFIVMTDPGRMEALCPNILKEFDQRVTAFYNPEDTKRGKIISTDRQGNLQEFPLLSIAIGVCHNSYRPLTTYAQISQLGAELKKHAKRYSKSHYEIDRRKD